MQKTLPLALIVLLALVTAQPAWPQATRDAPARPAPSVTATEAQQALEVLQDDGKRGQLIQTLQTIAKTSSSGATPAPSAALPADNLGVQVMVQVSNWFGEASSQLATAARAVTDFPMILHWVSHLVQDPNARHLLLDTAWKLALVLACALAIEWIVWRALRRPLSAIVRYVPAARACRHAAAAGARRPVATRLVAQTCRPGHCAAGSGAGAAAAPQPRLCLPVDAPVALRARAPRPRACAGDRVRGGRQHAARDRDRQRAAAAHHHPRDRQRLCALPLRDLRDAGAGVARREPAEPVRHRRRDRRLYRGMGPAHRGVRGVRRGARQRSAAARPLPSGLFRRAAGRDPDRPPAPCRRDPAMPDGRRRPDPGARRPNAA